MFTVSCPQCAATYQLDEAKVGPQGRKLKCAKCGHIWVAQRPADPEPVAPAEPVASVPVPPVETPSVPAEQATEVPPPPVPEGEVSAAGEAPEVEGTPIAVSALPVPEVQAIAGVGRMPWRRRVVGLVARERKWLLFGLLLLFAGVAGGVWVVLERMAPAAKPSAEEVVVAGKLAGKVVEAPQGVLLMDVASGFVQDDREGNVFVVSGILKNTTDRDIALPGLRVELVDPQGVAADVWPVTLDQKVLPALAEMPWRVSFTSPPVGKMSGWRAQFVEP